MTNDKVGRKFTNSRAMLNKLKYPLAVIGLTILGLIGFGSDARAAVPVWVVGFDNTTDYQKSLQGFLTTLFGQLAARQETFLQAYDLTKIMKAREDVNKLIFEAFSELRNEPLLLEFQKIRKICDISNPEAFIPNPLNPTPPDLSSLKGQCAFYTQVQEYLRTRGLEIISKPFNPDAIGAQHAQAGLDNLGESGVITPAEHGVAADEIDPMCLYGVRTNDGECIVIKLEGRIITNPDDFLFEEPIQKARDFLYCYFGAWRHYPWAATREEADLMRDNMKNHFLLTIARKLKFTQTAPPAEWYTEARCQLILASMQCPLASQPLSETPGAPQDTSNFPTINRDRACVARELVNSPTLSAPLEFMSWTMADLHKAVTREENTVNATYAKVANTITAIIGDYGQLRQAQYVAGQGLRPEKYLIGYRSYTPDEYKQLTDAWQKGETAEDEQRIQPTGDWFYFDTENIISPAVILLQKMQAATQAEFDLAQQAFQAPKVPDSNKDNIAFSGPGPCEDKPPAPLPRLEYDCREFKDDAGNLFHYWATRPFQPEGPDETQGYYALTPNLRSLSAPWEDPNVELPPEYLTGQKPRSKDEQPALSGNFFNQWYKDILELHKWHFSAIVQQWFQKPEKSFFVPDR